MRVIKKIVIACLLLLVGLTACNTNNEEVRLKSIDLDKASKDVAQFVADHESENGIYLYQKQDSIQYLYLNEYHVVQGDSGYYFTDVSASLAEGSLIISVQRSSTDDYSSVTNNQLLYEIRVNGSDVDVITVYQDDEESAFDAIAGAY